MQERGRNVVFGQQHYCRHAPRKTERRRVFWSAYPGLKEKVIVQAVGEGGFEGHVCLVEEDGVAGKVDIGERGVARDAESCGNICGISDRRWYIIFLVLWPIDA